jgi:hypothetical protein
MTEINPYNADSRVSGDVRQASHTGPHLLDIGMLVLCIGICAAMLGGSAYGIYAVRGAANPAGVGAAHMLVGGVCTMSPIAIFWVHIALAYRTKWSTTALLFAWLPAILLVLFVAWFFVAVRILPE